MSWQEYIDKQLINSNCVTKAAICGLEGDVWAKSDDFEVTKPEVQALIKGFENTTDLASNGVTLAGQRYIYLSGTDRIVRGKLGRNGIHCMKTTQGIIISVYEDPVQPQQAATVVEKLGDYLISCGY